MAAEPTTLRDPRGTPQEQLLTAAKYADWGQILSNGGPPCFHVEKARFCLRSQHWAGHNKPAHHKFVSLADLLILVINHAD